MTNLYTVDKVKCHWKSKRFYCTQGGIYRCLPLVQKWQKL